MKHSKTLRKVIISGGGTGGHIFPAIAIANTIKIYHPDCEILFIGAVGKMEMEKVPNAGYPIEGLNIAGLQRRKIWKNFSFPFKLISSIRKARKIVLEFKPDVVIGVGGYASGPTLRVASVRKIPTLIQEQNSYPGITNKILSKRVNKICVAYEGLERFFPKEKIIITGNPVREEVVDIKGKKEEALKSFGLEREKPVIFIVGGSLGAKTLNDSIKGGLKKLKQQGIQLIWQCGKFYHDQLQEELKEELDQGIVLTDFISRMDYAYAASDVIISRAGALAVSEIELVHRPAILVPSPNVAEDHQTKNAMALVKNNAALMVKDLDARTTLVDTTLELLNNESKRKELSSNIEAMAHENACEKIYAQIMEIV